MISHLPIKSPSPPSPLHARSKEFTVFEAGVKLPSSVLANRARNLKNESHRRVQENLNKETLRADREQQRAEMEKLKRQTPCEMNRLYVCTVVPLYRCTVVPLYRLYVCTFVPLYRLYVCTVSCTVVPLYRCTVVPLYYRCTVVPLYCSRDLSLMAFARPLWRAAQCRSEPALPPLLLLCPGRQLI